MNAKNINEILDALAARLSVPASHLWAVLVRQAAVEFWQSFIVFLVSVPLLAGAAWWLRREVKSNDYDDLCVPAGIVVVMAGIFVVISGISLVVDAGYLVNPEYYALKQVLGAFK